MPNAEKTKVLSLIAYMGAGGGETMAIETITRLDPERYERTICITRYEELLETAEPAAGMLRRAREAGVRVIGMQRPPRAHASRLASSRLANLWRFWPILRMVRRERIDIVHGHLFGSNVWACLIGRLARVRAVVAHEHMWAYGGSRGRALVDRWLIARWSDAFIAVSEEGRRRMIEVERIPADDIVLMRNAVAESPRADPQRVRSEFGLAPEQPLVVSAGSLRAEKAYEVLIEAAAKLAEKIPEVTVLIAGDGPEREKLERAIAEFGVGDRVKLLGWRADVPDLVAAADVGVCCSDFEGGPLSVLEYMSAGRPVVATAVGGLPELVEDGVTGILIPPRDPAALAEAVGGLLTDPERRERLGAAGRSLREREYSFESYMQRLEGLYQSLLAR
jgi:glycosyltransferase involved in cell wall biosynthesis